MISKQFMEACDFRHTKSGMAVSLTVGENFSSYGALQSKIELYQCSHSVQLYKRSSRSINAARSRFAQRSHSVTDSLKFSKVTL